ncbi:biosynthetic-type acetolactate synthase large subunit [Mobilibacterium timonense]|uniref:biosynthetic-type acetolactate synthase large subunit n=1 Tax=Mobilibacterium timonense TaxID=1871012 RepID=UPI003A90999B
MKLTGSQIVAEVLLEHGVDVVFGYPGGTALNIYDELYKYSDRIRHVRTADEQGASYAADGYARATGKTGVMMSTSGPGATNLVTGLATAFMDSVPVVAITSNVPDSLIGKDSFQEISITNVTMSITKHNFFVNRIEDLADSLRDAFRIAQSGRKGPVLVDITKDVTAATIEYEKKEPLPLKAKPKVNEEQVRAAAQLINEAERPVIYAGGGVIASEAEILLQELAHKADIPVVHTLMACGVLSSDDPLNLGMIGMHGSIAANRAVDHADLVIALGARFSDRVALNPGKFARRAKILQVDVDRSEVDKNVMVDMAVIADDRSFLEVLTPYVKETKHGEWHERVLNWETKHHYIEEGDADMHPSDIMKVISENCDPDAYFVTDVGQHQMWAAQYLNHRKARRFITSGGLGTMGYGYGAAIGTKIGRPDNQVIMITGDGSFNMDLNEVITACKEKLPIITVLVNNSVLGMVYQWQTIFYDKRYSTTLNDNGIDYVKVAEGFGAKGYKCTTPEEFEKAFNEAQKADGPVWIECIISSEERVLPMIPGGKSVDDMIIN